MSSFKLQKSSFRFFETEQTSEMNYLSLINEL